MNYITTPLGYFDNDDIAVEVKKYFNFVDTELAELILKDNKEVYYLYNDGTEALIEEETPDDTLLLGIEKMYFIMDRLSGLIYTGKKGFSSYYVNDAKLYNYKDAQKMKKRFKNISIHERL